MGEMVGVADCGLLQFAAWLKVVCEVQLVDWDTVLAKMVQLTAIEHAKAMNETEYVEVVAENGVLAEVGMGEKKAPMEVEHKEDEHPQLVAACGLSEVGHVQQVAVAQDLAVGSLQL